MTFPAFLLHFVVYFVQCFQQQLCQAPECRSHPSREHVCSTPQAACLRNKACIWLLCHPMLSLFGYGDRQKTARPKLSWNKTSFQPGNPVKDAMSKSWALGPVLSYYSRAQLTKTRPLREKKKPQETAVVTPWQRPHCGLVSAINSLL